MIGREVVWREAREENVEQASEIKIETVPTGGFVVPEQTHGG